MASNNSAEYYVQRAEQALGLAARAHSDDIRNIHLDMAARYAEMSGHSQVERPTLSIVAGQR